MAGGGTLVLNYGAGTQKMDNTMRQVLAPGPFAKMAGVIAEAAVDLIEYPILKNEGFGIGFSRNEAVFHPRTILESLRLQGAEPIATFRGDRMDGRPAVTRNRFGQGWVFYVGTDCAENGFYETLARNVGSTGKFVPLIAAPYGVEVVSREDSRTTYYFLLNLTEVSREDIELPHAMDNLIAERTAMRNVSLGPLDVAVLASPKIEAG